MDAVGVITGLYLDYQLLRTANFNNRLSSTFVDYWAAKQIYLNNVHVNNGSQVIDFVRYPDGIYYPPPGSAAKVSVTGSAPPLLYPGKGGLPNYDYSAVGLKLTNSDGSFILFDNAAYSVSATAQTVGSPQFKANSWTFPTGAVVKFNYALATITSGTGETNISPTSNSYYLSSVTNSFGRSLTFADTLSIASTTAWAISSVTDDNGRVVKFATSNCPANTSNPGGGAGESQSAAFVCNSFTVTEPDTSQWVYTYGAGSDSPDPSVITKPAYHLRHWFTPGNLTTPYSTISYDGAYRVATVTDMLGHSHGYYASALVPTEWWKRTDLVDPLGNVTTEWFDQWNDEIQSRDPLGRITTDGYDGWHRKILETRPLGDSSAFTYDVRSNLLSTTLNPVPGLGCGTPNGTGPTAGSCVPLVTSNTYEEGASVFSCVNPVICNLPATKTDARGAITNYGWIASTGQLTQILKPEDSSGNRPESDYAYTGFTGSDGSTLSLLTSRIVKFTTSTSQTTSYAYNTSNHLTLQTATVDPTGQNLRTCFKFDSLGNLISSSDPRAGTCP